MAAADTARLIASLELQDKLTPGLRNATASVATAEKRINALSGRASSFASNLRGPVSGALNTFSGRLRGAASAGASLLGVGGLLGGFALIGKSVQEAATFGENVEKVARVTNLSVPIASSMVDTLDKWGVSSDRLIPLLGKMEKNLGAIAAKKDGLAAFRKEFGVSLTDSNGKILDANTLLLKSADYFNSNATATQKATFLSKLYGKQWQDLIPILSKGSAFIKAQEQDSIKLTKEQLDNITKYRTASRDFQDTLGDLEVKIGANIMPLLTRGLTNVSTWLDAHADDVADFFKGAADMAGTVAGAAVDVFKAVQAGWNTIPGPLRDLLVKGLVADRTVKFLFGFSPIEAIGKGLLGGVAGSFFQRGSPGNPMWVTSATGGLGAGAGAAGGLAGAVRGALIVTAAAAIADAVEPFTTGAGVAIHDALGLPKFTLNDLQWPLGPKNTPTILPEIFGGNGALGGTASPTSLPGLNVKAPAPIKVQEVPQILKDMGARDQRLGEMTGGKFDILSAHTSEAIDAVERARQAIVTKQEVANSRLLHATDDLEAIRAKRWTITNNLRINVPVTNRTTTYRYTTTQYSDSSSSSLAVKTSTDQLR